MIRIKRVYDPPATDDGRRVLVDRLWPRGLTKEAARLDEWLKEIAPSEALRKWFGHDPARWGEFRERYREELKIRGELLRGLCAEAEQGPVTLLYAAKDTEHNNAVVVQEIIQHLI